MVLRDRVAVTLIHATVTHDIPVMVTHDIPAMVPVTVTLFLLHAAVAGWPSECENKALL